jgi:hypothetical protein
MSDSNPFNYKFNFDGIGLLMIANFYALGAFFCL